MKWYWVWIVILALLTVTACQQAAVEPTIHSDGCADRDGNCQHHTKGNHCRYFDQNSETDEDTHQNTNCNPTK